MTDSRLIYGAIMSFALGIVFAAFGISSLLWILIIGVAMVFAIKKGAILEYGYFFMRSQISKTALFIVAILMFFALGGIRLATYDKNPDPLLENTKGKVEITGLISEDPDVRPDQNRLTLRVESVNGLKISNKSKIILITSLFPEYKYGERVEVTGKLAKPKNFDTDTGTFDYIHYLEKDRIYFLLYHPQIIVVEKGAGNPIISFLLEIKHAFMNSVSSVLPEPHSSLINALILGVRQSLGSDLLDLFRTVGIIHIVVLSGYNITIVAESVRRIFSRFPYRLSLSLAAVSIVLFVLMTGASSTIVRAGIMALLVFLSRAFARKYDVVRALFITLFLMIFWNPMILAYDISFQLSFLATVALIFVAPLIEKKWSFVPKNRILFILKNVLITTLSAQILVLPYLTYAMGNISLVALPVNLLILPFVPATMLFGALSGFLGIISPVLAYPFAVITKFLTSYELFVSKIFAQIPFASISVSIPFILVLCIYALIFFLILRFQNSPRSLASLN